ncbi:MAG TPA: GH3 auxin-responsive promoter family protein [Thermoanaerobaculia bacterium]|nr:GH3 auxin-responsive promoter family protein [Thermoanaerobaculia bacterium]
MICGLANSLWLAGCLPERARFRRAIRNVRAEQGKILRRLVPSAKSVRDYQQRVPLNDEIHTPKNIKLLQPTSGSSGPTKLIPYTDSLQREFQRGIRAWIADLFLDDPQLMFGPAYWSVSPPSCGTNFSPSGIPIGFDDDSAYVGGWQRRLVQSVMVRTREELVRARNLRLISVWNPTFLSILAEGLDTEKLWPNLRLISCWTDANAAAPAARLAKLFPQARIQGKGLIATEGFISFPLTGQEGSVLAIRSHFLEFIPLGSETPLLAHELDEGQQYAVVITTGGGLYRYQLNDVIEVVGRIGQCPLIRFVGRQGLVSDWFGEKLNEAFVAGVLRQTFEEMNIAPAFAMLACDPDTPAYVLTIDGEVPEQLAERIETRLRQSFHYDYARFLGQLQMLRIAQVPHAAAVYQQFCVCNGQKAGDVKPLALDRRPASQIFPASTSLMNLTMARK